MLWFDPFTLSQQRPSLLLVEAHVDLVVTGFVGSWLPGGCG